MRVLITGTSSGIGYRTALKFLVEGHTVEGIDIKESKINHKCYTHHKANVVWKSKYHKIKWGKITKSIITINTKLLTIYANTQARASLILSGSEIPFEHFYNNYLTSVTLHEFGHTLGMPDLMDDMYFNKSIMHYANFELIELTEYDKGSIEARYRSETK